MNYDPAFRSLDCTFYATQIMIVRRRVAVVLYINVFFSQSYINHYAIGQVCFAYRYEEKKTAF